MAKSRYSLEERLAIGGRIYRGEINRYQAAVEYGMGVDSCRNYMRMYRAANNLPEKRGRARAGDSPAAGEDA